MSETTPEQNTATSSTIQELPAVASSTEQKLDNPADANSGDFVQQDPNVPETAYEGAAAHADFPADMAPEPSADLVTTSTERAQPDPNA